MRRKTFEVEVKAGGAEGEFVALASVFNNVDLVGDRMMPGAFSKTLADWRASGDPIPVVLSHQWDDPMAYVGKADPNDVTETDEGLVVRGQLDTNTAVGAQVYKLMKDRLLKAWSFGYTVPSGGEEFKDGANNVTQVDLIEVGPTLKGANPEARSLAVKAAEQEPEETDSEEEVPAEEPPPPRGEDEGREEPEGSVVKASDPLKDEIDRTWLEVHAGIP